MSLMSSFYGGRVGAAFIIVKRFESINDMADFFKRGAQTLSDVNYGEYVIIDTLSKNSPDNGKVYRRGFNIDGGFDLINGELKELPYNIVDDKGEIIEYSGIGGAEYIGQIVGPQGQSPKLEIKSILEMKDYSEEYSYLKDKYGENEFGFNSYAASEENFGLIPGKFTDENNETVYTDEIYYGWCTIRDQYENITGAYIGFTFPYLINEFTANSVSPYKQNGEVYSDSDKRELITRIDDKIHPFYNKWKIDIPKGIKGDSVNNLEIASTIIPKGTPIFNINSNEITRFTSDNMMVLKNNIQDDKYIVNNNEYIKISDLRGEVLRFEILNYDNKKDGIPKYKDIKYNEIKDIYMLEDGTIYVDYGYDGKVPIGNPIGINDIKINTDSKDYNKLPSEVFNNIDNEEQGTGDQKVYIKYNDGAVSKIGMPLNYIIEVIVTEANNIYLAPADHLYVLYSDPELRKKIPENRRGTYYSNALGKMVGDKDKYDDTSMEFLDGWWYDLGNVRGLPGHFNGVIKDSDNNIIDFESIYPYNIFNITSNIDADKFDDEKLNKLFVDGLAFVRKPIYFAN